MEEQTPEQKIAKLQMDVKALQQALGMLLAWMPQSSVSPIRIDEASHLINIMNGND